MNKTIAYCSLLLSVAVVVVLSSSVPNVLGDSNEFLRNFVGADLLFVLGVILPITLGAASQIHLTLNQIEERHKEAGFASTRQGLKTSTYWLIGLFVVGTALVVTKPLLAEAPWAQSLFNGTALIILEWYILILISLTEMIFAIRADLDDHA